ncbi:MAG: SpoIIIAH-like family protein [Bacilli bacterium]
MINKQKMWFLTLFTLILVLSVYYITMPSELLTTIGPKDKTAKTKEEVAVTETSVLTSLQVESDEERAETAASYNEVLTSKTSTTEEKNNAYEQLKSIDKTKAKEEELEKKVKSQLKLDSFIKIENNKVSVTIEKKDHDYVLANSVMRLVQESYDSKMYVSVKFEK